MEFEAIVEEGHEEGIDIVDSKGEFIRYENDEDEAEDGQEVEENTTLGNNEAIDPDLVATIAALGSYEGGKYVKGEECAICIVDIIKFLRLEDKHHCDIRLQVAKSECMEKDLLPILSTYTDDSDIFDALVRLLVNLTMPSLICMSNEENKLDKKQRFKIELEINNYLRSYKSLFLQFNVMKFFSSKLSSLLELGKTNRSDDDDLLLERLLIVIRNILHVPSDTNEELEFQQSASIHDRLVISVIEYGISDLLLYICGSQSEEQHCILALEITSLLFRDFEAETLAAESASNIRVDKELQAIKEKEDLIKRQQMLSRKSRHSRFNGTFVVQGKKSITEKDLIYHKDIKKVKDLSFDSEKTMQRHTRFNEIVEDRSLVRLSTLEVRRKLKELSGQFLDLCYNRVMKNVKSLLCRNLGSANDESFYMWACKFFMQVNRLTDFKIQLVAETLSIDTFSYILSIIFKFQEDIKTLNAKQIEEKRKAAKRLHKAIKAYHEMLENLYLMITSRDSKIKSIGSAIENTIFYHQEYRELPTILLKQFHTRIFTKSYLADLILCTHLYIRMLEAYTKANTLIVQETKRKKVKKIAKKKKKRNLLSDAELLAMWEGDIENEVINILSSNSIYTDHVRPFDASSDLSMEQQRVLTKHKIQDLLKSGSFDEAVALYRSAREVWPNSASFGYADMAIVDESNVIKSIFMSNEDIPEMMESAGDQEDVMEAERGESNVYSVKENKFQNTDYHMLYARPNIVQAYSYLLQFFETNSVAVNHAITKMLYRVTKLAMTPLMYQVTFFITLQRLLAAPKFADYKEMQRFASFVVRKFIATLKETPLVCVDAVFWKNPDDVLMIDNQYDESKLPLKKKTVKWTPQEEEEVKELYRKWIDKAHQVDICEVISQDMTTGEKQRMDVKRKIIELKLVEGKNAEILNKKPKTKVDWLDHERESLRNLYEEYKYDRDPVALIQEKLNTKTRLKIIKELEMSLGVRKKDLDVNRVIWTKDDDEELTILYSHLSESFIGTSLLEAIAEKIPKPRTGEMVKDALIRLKLRRDERSDAHFWTKAEVAILSEIDKASDKGAAVNDIKQKLVVVSYDDILTKLVQLGKLSTEESGKLLLELTDSDSESESEEEEVEGEEYDFFEIPDILGRIKSSLSSEIDWISNVVKTALTNREDLLDYDTVFVIPRTDDHQSALSNTDFVSLLKCLGITPPLSSFETYWKINSDISDNILRSGYDMLIGNVSEDLDIAPSMKPDSEDSEDSDIDSFFDKIRHKSEKFLESEKENVPSFDENASSSTFKRKKIIDSDSDSDIDNKTTIETKKRQIKVVFSDSDD